MTFDYCVCLLLQDLVFRPLVLVGSDWTAMALILSLAPSGWACGEFWGPYLLVLGCGWMNSVNVPLPPSLAGPVDI